MYSQKHTESLEILHFSWGIVIKSIELSFHGQSPQHWETKEKNIRVEKKWEDKSGIKTVPH